MRTKIRLIGALWLFGGLTGLVVFTLRGWDVFQQNEFLWQGIRETGFGASMLPVLLYFMLCILGGWGLTRVRNWARLMVLSVAPFLLIYCLLFLLMVGAEFGLFNYCLAWVLLFFSLYSMAMLLFRWSKA